MSEDSKTDETAAALAKMQESIDRLETKNAELIGENRRLKRAGEIKPEDLAAAEDRADKAEAALAEATKQVKALTTERDKAVQALEQESSAGRSRALEAEIMGAIAKGNVVPALVPALKAMMSQQAKADLVDGQYAVMIGDKPARDYIGAFLDSDDGKHFKAAASNGGGGAPGGGGAANSKVLPRSQQRSWEAEGNHAAIMEFTKAGGRFEDQAA